MSNQSSNKADEGQASLKRNSKKKKKNIYIYTHAASLQSISWDVHERCSQATEETMCIEAIMSL